MELGSNSIQHAFKEAAIWVSEYIQKLEEEIFTVFFSCFVWYRPTKTRHELFTAVILGKYSLDGPEWTKISAPAKDLVRKLLMTNPLLRLTINQVMEHPWLKVSGNTYYLKEWWCK